MSEDDNDKNIDSEIEFPVYVNSSPLGLDQFEGQSQEQIATSIAKLISTNRTASKLVGIDGPWGSGKSNLVKIIERKLSKTHHSFLYDAWGHQEDLQRRAFLEELTEDLYEKQLVDKAEWEEKLKDLLARKKETITKTIPRISNGVIAAFSIAIAMPIASSIAESISDQMIKTAVTSLPALAGLLIWAVGSIRRRKFLSTSDIFYLYNEQNLVNEVHETISEKQPSVKEFRNWMQDLSDSLKKKHLIIVFDNMDRLPPEKVKDLWSSVHTFFAEKSLTNIWVLIPFDRNHLTAAFDDKEEVADNFLSKTFSVVYYVSPPVLTDWQKFFNEKFEDAFGAEDLEELTITRRIFDLFNKDITPREIISFINELVSLRLIVTEDIRLKYMAIFVLSKKTILESPVDQIVSLDFLGRAKPLFIEDSEVQNNISALVYQVPLNSASQVLLTREIKTSLHDQDDVRLNELTKHLHFMNILEQVFNEYIENSDDIENPIITLSLLSGPYIEKFKLQHRISGLWEILCKKALRESISEQELSSAQQLLIANSPDDIAIQFIEHFITGIRNVEAFQGSTYFISLDTLKNTIEEKLPDVEMLSLLSPIEKSPPVFIDYLKEAGSQYTDFKLTCDEEGLNKFLIDRVPDDLKDLSSISIAKNEIDFGDTLTALEHAVDKNAITNENFSAFYQLYKSIASEKIKLPPDQTIHTLIETNPENYELLAMRLSRVSSFPAFGGVSDSMLLNIDELRVKNIAKRIQEYEYFGTLLVCFVAWNQPLLKAVLREIILSHSARRMNVINVIPHFKTLYSTLEIEPEVLIKCLNIWSPDAAEKITEENIAKVIVDHEYYSHSAALDLDITKHTNRTIISYLNNSLAIDDWRAAFHDAASFDFIVTRIMFVASALKALPDDAFSAYKELLVEAAKGEVNLGNEDGWDMFYDRANKNKLKPTAKNIRDMFISEINITPKVFKSLSSLLIHDASLEKRSADVARRILTPIVDDPSSLNIILEHSEYFEGILNEAGDDASDFKDKLRQVLSSTKSSEGLLSFAKAIKVELDSG